MAHCSWSAWISWLSATSDNWRTTSMFFFTISSTNRARFYDDVGVVWNLCIWNCLGGYVLMRHVSWCLSYVWLVTGRTDLSIQHCNGCCAKPWSWFNINPSKEVCGKKHSKGVFRTSYIRDWGLRAGAVRQHAGLTVLLQGKSALFA